MIKLATLLALVLGTVISQDAKNYYGLPLGALHNSASSTSADVYAADPKTIIITNFVHKPQPGCTTLMAGPKRFNTPEVAPSPNGDGILLSVKDVFKVVNDSAPRRNRRADNLAASSFFNWPFQFDQLNAAPTTGGSVSPNAFAGITLDRSREVTEGQKSSDSWFFTTAAVASKSAEALDIPWTLTKDTTEGSVETTTSVANNGLILFPEASTQPTAGTSKQPSIWDTTTTTTPRPYTTRVYTFKPVSNIEPRLASINSAPQPAITTSRFVFSPQTTTTTQAPTTTQEAITRVQFGGSRERVNSRERATPSWKSAEKPKSQEFLAVEAVTESNTRPNIGRGILVSDGESNSPSNVHPNFFGRLPRPKNFWPASGENQTTFEIVQDEPAAPPVTGPTPHATTPLHGDISGERGYTAVLGRRAPSTTARPFAGANSPAFGPPGGQESAVFVLGSHGAEPPRRAEVTSAPATPPSRAGVTRGSRFDYEKHIGEWSPRDLNNVDILDNVVTTAAPSDPHAPTPLFVIVEDPREKRRQDRITIPPEFAPQSTTPSLPAPRDGGVYSLQELNGENMIIHFPENANVNEFEWFGIYDQCLNQRTAYVNTRDIKPPQETYVDGIVGIDRTTNSGPLSIMNCNTIMITDFSFKPEAGKDAYLIAGIGDFPRNVVQQTRVIIVGQAPDTPLRQYKNEDVLIKLPDQWKTFDINFLAVFNQQDRVSYGHSIIPPAIVPPCEGSA